MIKSQPRLEFGSRLKALREERGLSQDKLGEEIGMSRKDLIAVEKGHINYGIDKLFIILKALSPSNTELGELFNP